MVKKTPPLPSSPNIAMTFFTVVLGAAGLFFGLPNTVFHFPPAVTLYPACLYLLASKAPTVRIALLHGWLLGFCGNWAGLYWLLYPMHNEAGMPLIVAAPCLSLLFACFALYGALACFAFRNIRLLCCNAERVAYPGVGLLPPVLCGLAFGGFEVLGGWLFTGFPWLSLSTGFAFWTEWVQCASLIGSYALSALYAVFGCCIAEACYITIGVKRRYPVVIALALAMMIPAFGVFRLALPEPNRSEQAIRLFMVQGNIEQSQKWDASFQQGTINHYLSLTKRALLHERQSINSPSPALIIWPETAMPFYFELHNDYASSLRRFASDNGVHLAFGTLGVLQDPRKSSLFNRLYLLGPSGNTAGYYDKQHLVPFGEYVPFATNLPFLQGILQNMDFSSGMQDSPLLLKRANKPTLSLGVLICYEAIFPYLSQKRVADGSNILVNVSNDGWFGRSSAPLQHLSHAMLRALEQARPVLRATNTGITAVIDSRGRITSQINEIFEANTLVTTVQPSFEITVFHHIFPVPEIILTALALFGLFAYKLQKPKDRNSNASTA